MTNISTIPWEQLTNRLVELFVILKIMVPCFFWIKDINKIEIKLQCLLGQQNKSTIGPWLLIMRLKKFIISLNLIQKNIPAKNKKLRNRNLIIQTIAAVILILMIFESSLFFQNIYIQHLFMKNLYWFVFIYHIFHDSLRTSLSKGIVIVSTIPGPQYKH